MFLARKFVDKNLNAKLLVQMQEHFLASPYLYDLLPSCEYVFGKPKKVDNGARCPDYHGEERQVLVVAEVEALLKYAGIGLHEIQKLQRRLGNIFQ